MHAIAGTCGPSRVFSVESMRDSSNADSMLDALPSTSFEPFTVPHLTAARALWRNDAIASTLDIASYDFCQPHDGDANSAYCDQWRSALAEHYGGQRIVNNGGGVRCGLVDGIQIKGIGSNPLAGKTRNFWYSHGGATLEKVIREAVWGEVCTRALPFGGVRVLGILATGTETHFKDADGNAQKVVRALILRQAALRPAHFMRAIYYEPHDDIIARGYSDTERTRAAIG